MKRVTVVQWMHDEIEERVVDVDVDHLAVGKPAVEGVDLRRDLAVEHPSDEVVVLRAGSACPAGQRPLRRDAPDRRRAEHGDPPCPEIVQLLKEHGGEVQPASRQ